MKLGVEQHLVDALLYGMKMMLSSKKTAACMARIRLK